MTLHCLTPDLRVEHVGELTAERLQQLGVKALLLDVDGTLKRYRAKELPVEVVSWLTGLATAGVQVCLVSNGRAGRIGELAGRYGLPFVAQACKPLARGCRAALQKLGVAAAEAAMVGDQVLADVWAGKSAGVRTVLVRPIHPEEEPWFTRLKRPIERLLGRRA